jgi:hypothetical protein
VFVEPTPTLLDAGLIETVGAAATHAATVVVTVVLVPVVWPVAAAETDVVSEDPFAAPAVADVVSVPVSEAPGLIGPIVAGTVEALKFVFGVAGVSVLLMLNVVAAQAAVSLFVTVIV